MLPLKCANIVCNGYLYCINGISLQPILSINNISKRYGPILALNNVSFEVPEGSVFGILGPNGSGKTTLLSMVLDVLNPNSGSYSWFGGMELSAARKQIGSLLETPNFYHYLSAMQNLEISAALKDTRTDTRLAVLEQTGLLARKDSLFQSYSLGMKQRLAIAAALLGTPKVLLLDEPTNGLDPEGIAEIRNLIVQLSRQGTTIIMASHMLDEVEKVCTHVAILKKGTLLVHGPVNEVLTSDDLIELRAADMERLRQVVTGLQGINKSQIVNGTLLLEVTDAIKPEMINEHCSKNGIVLSHLLLKKKSLENKFIEITNSNK